MSTETIKIGQGWYDFEDLIGYMECLRKKELESFEKELEEKDDEIEDLKRKIEDLKDMKTDLEFENEKLVNKIEFIENDVLNKK
jgi:chromosome segregation ATPase